MAVPSTSCGHASGVRAYVCMPLVGLVVVVHTPRLLPARDNAAGFQMGHSLHVLTLATWELPLTRESSGMAMECVPFACLAGERIISAISGASAMLQRCGLRRGGKLTVWVVLRGIRGCHLVVERGDRLAVKRGEAR